MTEKMTTWAGCARFLSLASEPWPTTGILPPGGGHSKTPPDSVGSRYRSLSAGFVLQNNIVWVKNISLSDRAEDSYGQFKPINSKRYLNQTHEFIFHLTKAGETPIDRLAVGVPFIYESNIKRFGHKNNLRCRGNNLVDSLQDENLKGEEL